MLRRDNLRLGIILGFLAPLLGLVIYYFIVFYPINASFKEFLYQMKSNRGSLTGISSISLVANAVLFTIYVNSHRDNTAKGIFLATIVYAIAVLLIKVIK